MRRWSIEARTCWLVALAGAVGACDNSDLPSDPEPGVALGGSDESQPGVVWVTDYGAKCDCEILDKDCTDDTASIEKAIKAIVDSTGAGEVHFPAGGCLVTGLNITERVTLVGQGGGCQVYAPGDQRGDALCSTIIRSETDDKPVVKFTVKDRTGELENRFFVGLKDLALLGNGTATFDDLNEQHCLQVDNRGLEAYNVTLAHCGGHGLFLTDSVISNFYNLKALYANGDGINNDDTSTFAQDGSANGTNVFGGESSLNGRDGVRIQRNGWGTSTFGLTVEQNTEYGIRLIGDGNNGYARFCRFMSTWDELNHGGSVYFGDAALNNLVDYVRDGSGPPVRESMFGDNFVWGANLSGTGPGSDPPRNLYQFGTILSVRLDSLHDDQVIFRNKDDTADGRIQVGSIKATYLGTADDVAQSGAIRLTNGQGVTSRDAANEGDITLAQSTEDDEVSLGTGATGVVVDAPSLLLGVPTTFTQLPGDQPDGSLVYCSDCSRTAPCAAGGTGAFAKRLASAWVCD